MRLYFHYNSWESARTTVLVWSYIDFKHKKYLKRILTFVRNMRYLLNPVVQTRVTAFRLSVEFYDLKKLLNCADDVCSVRHINGSASIDFNN